MMTITKTITLFCIYLNSACVLLGIYMLIIEKDLALVVILSNCLAGLFNLFVLKRR